MGEEDWAKAGCSSNCAEAAVANRGLTSGATAVTWLEGRSLSYETSTPYAPFADLMVQMIGLQDE